MSTVHLQILWHFHQPYYAKPGADGFDLPWVRLHSAKSYLDMAAVLERHPSFRCTANFSGVLLEQLMRYTEDGWRDTYWDLTLQDPDSLDESTYRRVLRGFFSLNHDTVVARFPRYRELLAKRSSGERFVTQELLDLQVLFNLAWCGFTLRESDPRIVSLIAKERDYSQQDRELVLEAHLDAMGEVSTRWRSLVETGQVELSVTPHYHPILPLLIDTDSARRCMATAPLPARFCFPSDAEEHIDRGLAIAERYFGTRPRGIWPSEGSVSPELLALVQDRGLMWLASDEGILHGSDVDIRRTEGYENRAWSLDGEAPYLFFRDHELSDLIGFSYSKSPADEAVSDFMGRLTARADDRAETCISVILDGENAWEHYPNDGKSFLETFHTRLSQADIINLTTPSSYLAQQHRPGRIRRLSTGSWINSDFRIWIGSQETNRAWDQLLQARALFDQVAPSLDDASRARARCFLLRAEGSDWMWWYGDDFQSMEDDIFDSLFRHNLVAVYQELGRALPTALRHPIGGATREIVPWPPKGSISPAIDGRSGGYLKWLGAGTLPVRAPGGTMAQSAHYFSQVRYGFDTRDFFLRACVQLGVLPTDEHSLRFDLTFESGETSRLFHVAVTAAGAVSVIAPETGKVVADSAAFFVDCLELSIPLTVLGSAPGNQVKVSLSIVRDGVELERLPRHGTFALKVTEDLAWFV